MSRRVYIVGPMTLGLFFVAIVGTFGGGHDAGATAHRLGDRFGVYENQVRHRPKHDVFANESMDVKLHLVHGEQLILRRRGFRCLMIQNNQAPVSALQDAIVRAGRQDIGLGVMHVE